MILSEY